MLSKILTFLFPTTCLGCDEPGAYLCSDCKKDLKPHPELCPFCHRVSPHYTTCLNCFPLYPKTQGIIIGFQYTGTIKQLVRKLKYDHREQLAPFLAERLSLLVQTHPPLLQALHANKLIITRVPSHWYRRWFVKGYNQSQLLAQQVAKYLQVSTLPLLTKIKHTRSQAKLSRKQRLANLINAFQIHPQEKQKTSLDDACVLIVDDITTTGSTINELAETISKTYPETKVWGLVIGRHGR